jgi:uncharacterized RDD family membrane protein YckC
MAERLALSKKEVPAGVLKRLLAFLIDLVVLNLVVVYPFRALIARLIPAGSIGELASALESSPGVLNQLNFVYITIGVLLYIYFTISESRLQQSLGKMLLGLQVKSGKESPSFWQIAVRNLFLLPVFPFVLLWLIDPLTLIFTKRRLSDIISKTSVISHETKLWF